MAEANNETNTNNSEAVGRPTVGRDAKFVKLFSADGYEFVIPKNEAMQAEMLGTMISRPGQFVEDEENAVHLAELPTTPKLKEFTPEVVS